VIEAFCARGLPGRASSTRGAYRSVLHQLAGPARGVPGTRATPFAGAKAPPPYSCEERAELAAFARAQRDPANRASALAMVVRRGRRAAARGAGRAARRRGRAPRRPSRRSCHRRPCAPRGSGGRALRGDGFVFRPGPADRGYKNFVNGFARRLAAGPGAPRPSMSRARSSFICDHLAAGTPIPALLAIAGIAEAGFLARHARHVEGVGGVRASKAALRARWREQSPR